MPFAMRRFPLPFLVSVCVLALSGCGEDDNNPAASDNPSAVVPEPAASSGGLRDFFGVIDGITSNRLVVSGTTFVVDGQTHVFRQGVEVGYGLLGLGNLVLVKARLNSQNELVAREIKLRVDAAPDVKVTGHVEKVDPPDLIVAGRLVHTNSGTSFFGVGDPRSLTDIQVGNQVTVTGPEGDERAILASKVRVESKN
ncbi:MAG TPA: DUF5666 domain-containing protein [Vicinamibacteria bacterium]|nr:DUF5666 domain-containing protein [Vicinamibacteria bacterium]